MLPGGEEEEGEEQLHTLLAADLGRTPPGSCPLGATAARGTHPLLELPGDGPGPAGQRAEGPPWVVWGERGQGEDHPRGHLWKRGCPRAPRYLCGIPGRMLLTASAGGRATASRRGCEGTPEPGVGGCTVEPPTCGDKGRGGGDPVWVLSPSWGPGGAPEGLGAAGAEPCSILCCHHNTSLLLATRAGLPPTAGQQKSWFYPQNLWLCCCPSGAELPRPPDTPPKPPKSWSPAHPCLISRSQAGWWRVPRQLLAGGTSFPCLGSRLVAFKRSINF